MLNRSSTSVLKSIPGKLDIKRHSPSILNTSACASIMSCDLLLVLKAMPHTGREICIKHRYILYIIEDIYFFEETTKYISSSVLKT